MKKIKKFHFILPVLFVLFFSACSTNKPNGVLKQENTSSDQISIEEENNTSTWSEQTYSEEDYVDLETYTNENLLNIEFSYPSQCKIKTKNQNPRLDQGKIESIDIFCNNQHVVSVMFISKDYVEGNGEGCCFYFADDTIDTNLSLEIIANKLKKFRATNIKKVDISEIKSIQFYSEKEYIDFWTIENTIIPIKHKDYSNIFIASPDITNINSFIIYQDIIKSIKLN